MIITMNTYNKPLHAIVYVLSLFFLVSCGHCDDVKCVEFDSKYKGWLSFNENENVKYTDNTNDLELKMNYKGFSGYYEIDASYSFISDTCNYTTSDCRQTSEMVGEFDTPIDGYNDFRVVVKNDFVRDGLNLYIHLYDFKDFFTVKPKVFLNSSLQKFHQIITLNGIEYNDVISLKMDTIHHTNHNYGGPEQRVWMVYYSKKEGLIAFKVRKPFRKTYYLKP